MKTININDVCSGGDIRIFLSNGSNAENQVQQVINDLRAGRDIHIELDHFFFSFDVYCKQKERLDFLRAEMPNAVVNSPAYNTIAVEILEIEKAENTLRADILELALTLNAKGQSPYISAVQSNYENGTLLRAVNGSEHIVVEQKRLEQLQGVDVQLSTISQLFIANSNEFLVKAQVTQMLYDLPDRYEQAVTLYGSGLISADYAEDINHLQYFTSKFGAFYKTHNNIERAIELYDESVCYALTLAAGDKEYELSAIAILNDLGDLHIIRNDFEKGTEYFTRSLKLEESWLHSDFNRVFELRASTYTGLGYLYRSMRSYKKAEQFYLKAMDLMFPKGNLKNDVAIGNIINLQSEMASLLSETGRFTEAENYYKDAFDTAELLTQRSQDIYYNRQAMLSHNLGQLYYHKNNFTEAIRLYECAASLFRKMAQKNPRGYLYQLSLTLSNFAIMAKDMYEFQKAEELFLECLHIREELVKENPLSFSKDLGMVLNNLGVLYTVWKRYNEASKCLERALEIDRQQFEVNRNAFSPHLTTTLGNLGVLYRDTQDFDKANKAFQESLHFSNMDREYVSTDVQIHFVFTYGNLGSLYLMQGNVIKADEYYDRVFEISKQLQESEIDLFEDTLAQTHNNIGVDYKELENYPKALEHLEIAYRLRQKGANANPKLAEIQNDLALVLYRTGRHSEAEPLFLKALEILEKTVAQGFILYEPTIAALCNNLGNFYGDLNEIKKAESHFLASLKINERQFEQDPVHYQVEMARNHYNLSQFYKDVAQEYGKSLRHIEKCINLLLPYCEVPELLPYLQIATGIREQLWSAGVR